MKVYLKTNVYDEALNRIRYIMDEFGKNVVVSFSGGKDSTVILELALIVAREKGLLPLKVMWLDQESEWTKTVEYCKRTFYKEEIEPYWMQVPFRLSNSASFEDNFLNVWGVDEEDKWLREKDPISYKDNIYGVDRFHDILSAITDWIFDKDGIKTYAVIYGLKSNESLNRKIALTSKCGYNNITWSNNASLPKNKHMKGWKFAPIYDWQDDDVWTAIAKNEWDYNTVYDEFFSLGEHPRKMRVSSLIHETSAEHSLLTVQEVDPKIYEKLTQRIQGVSTYSKLMGDVRVKDLPPAFTSWGEYRQYLTDNLIPEQNKPKFNKLITSKLYLEYDDKDYIDREICDIVLSADIDGTKFSNLQSRLQKKARMENGTYDDRYTIRVEE